MCVVGLAHENMNIKGVHHPNKKKREGNQATVLFLGGHMAAQRKLRR